LEICTLSKQLADKVGLTIPKLLAVVDYLGLRKDPDCYKEFKIGKTLHKRYSQSAIEKIREALKTESVDDIWRKRTIRAKGGSS
jgi:hypothetical protein